jgi:penicillin amidase
VYTYLLQDLQSEELTGMVPDALGSAAADFKDRSTWGELHVLKLSHPLGNVPLIGRKYRFGEYPAPGSTNTVMKRAHPLSNKKRNVTYGANARHISDLSDPDANLFVLVGGQDGYWGSENYLDLFRLWQKNEYVRVPLRLETVRQTFAVRMKLQQSK